MAGSLPSYVLEALDNKSKKGEIIGTNIFRPKDTSVTSVPFIEGGSSGKLGRRDRTREIRGRQLKSYERDY